MKKGDVVVLKCSGGYLGSNFCEGGLGVFIAYEDSGCDVLADDEDGFGLYFTRNEIEKIGVL
tara:strand:- start:861 stop:1046 length:186 start_codon:yes stop_codon:yes gene_type:complete